MEKFQLDSYMVESIEYMRKKRENTKTVALLDDILERKQKK